MKKKRIICSALAATMLLSAAVPAAGAAHFPDSIGHWSESAIDRWSDYGVIVGANGQFSPDAPITRGEMASIIAGMLGLEETASNRFSDLNGGWYTDAMLKCYAAGILVGDDLGLMRPYDNITGQEVAVILCKALGLSATPYASTGGMVIGEIDPWAQGYISALASRGAVTGNDGGYFVPMTNTSRAAVVSMFDRAISTYISSPGTYTATGLTIVNTSGTVTLKGTAGDVIVTAKSDKLKLKLDDTRVTGKLELRADEVQLTAEDADISGDIIVMGEKSTVALNGKTEAGTVRLESDAGSAKVTVAKNAEVNTIRTAAEKSDITVSGEVDDIELLSGATSSDVNVKSGAKVSDLDSQANKVTITGSGDLKRATISGDNNKIDTDDTRVTIEKGTSGTKVNGSSKKSGSTTSSSSSKNKDYDVDFYWNYGSKGRYTTKSVDSGDKVSKPRDPEREGYIFLGWYTDEDSTKSKYEYDFSDRVYDDLDLYAHWEKGYTVTFDYNDGTPSAKKVTVEKNSKVSKPSDPARTGYTFKGWFTTKDGTTAFDFNQKITDNTTAYAQWTAKEYTITINPENGTAAQTQTAAYNSKPTITAPTKEGYVFSGWYTDQECTKAFSGTVTGDVTLYAKWTEQYTVTFNSDDGSAVESQKIAKGGKATKPTAPTKEGYTFDGWYLNDATEAYDFNTPVTSNITLKAQWTAKESCKVIFNLNYTDAATATEQTGYKGDAVTFPNNPERTGYTFNGWFTAATGGEKVESATFTDTSKTLYAHWTANSYTVSFDLNAPQGVDVSSISVPDTISVTYGQQATIPACSITHTDYAITGWYAAKEGGETVASTLEIKENTTLYAHWAANPITETPQP